MMNMEHKPMRTLIVDIYQIKYYQQLLIVMLQRALIIITNIIILFFLEEYPEEDVNLLTLYNFILINLLNLTFRTVISSFVRRKCTQFFLFFCIYKHIFVLFTFNSGTDDRNSLHRARLLPSCPYHY